MGVALGLVVAFGVLRMGVSVHPLLLLGLIGLTVTFGMSCAALAMMIGALLAGLAGHRDPLGESRAPRALVAIAALPVGLLTTGGMIAVGMFHVGVALVAVVAFAFVAFAVVGWSRPWPTWVALLMLAMVFLTVEVARETGHMSVRWFESRSTSRTAQELGDSCQTEGNWDGPRTFRAFAHRADVYVDLDGNVGDLVRSPSPAPPGDLPSRVAAIEIRGSATAPLLGCWFPLYKRVTVNAHLDLSGRVVAEEQFGRARCTATGTLDVHLEYRAWGILSCHQLRRALAAELDTKLRKSVAEMID